MYSGWLQLDNTEIINNARLKARADVEGVPVGCEPCDGLRYALDDVNTNYTDPTLSPWYDPANAEASSGLWGIGGLTVTGTEATTATTLTTQKPLTGASLGVTQHARREMIFDVFLVGSEAGVQWGMSWLSQMLVDVCGPCAGTTLYGLDGCPQKQDGVSPDELYNQHLINIFDIGILDRPTIVSRTKKCGATIMRVSFSLLSGSPYIYRAPKLIDESSQAFLHLFGLPDEFCEPYECARPEIVGCEAPAVLAPAPIIPDPCTAQPNTSRESIRLIIPAEVTSTQIPQVLIVELDNRTDVALIKPTVSVVHDTAYSGDEISQVCTTIGNVRVSTFCVQWRGVYVPAAGTVTVDSRTQTMVAECIGQVRDPMVAMERDGRVAPYPVVDCQGGHDLNVDVAWYPAEGDDPTVGDVSARVWLVDRLEGLSWRC